MKIKFWGTRGSIPVPGEKTVKYGGNTSCVEITTFNKELILLDAGTGIREAGKSLLPRMDEYYGSCHLFLSHSHLDHIMGFPFFAPAFNPKYQIYIYGALKVDGRLDRSFKGIMDHLYFPIHLDEMGSNIHFHEILEEEVKISRYTNVISRYLNHPQGVYGYRIENGGRSVVYATDTEINNEFPEFEARLIEFSMGADVLIMDAQYTPSEYSAHKGWGHSTYADAANIARRADVGRLFLFHHEPDHTDDDIASIVEKTREIFPRTDAAREGETINMRVEIEDVMRGLYEETSQAVSDSVWVPDGAAPKTSELELKAGFMYIAFVRDIDLELINEALKRLKKETKRRVNRLQIHLEDVSDIDREEMTAVAELLAECSKNKIEVLISGVEPKVFDAFSMARITEVAKVEKRLKPQAPEA